MCRQHVLRLTSFWWSVNLDAVITSSGPTECKQYIRNLFEFFWQPNALCDSTFALWFALNSKLQLIWPASPQADMSGYIYRTHTVLVSDTRGLLALFWLDVNLIYKSRALSVAAAPTARTLSPWRDKFWALPWSDPVLFLTAGRKLEPAESGRTF